MNGTHCRRCGAPYNPKTMYTAVDDTVACVAGYGCSATVPVYSNWLGTDDIIKHEKLREELAAPSDVIPEEADKALSEELRKRLHAVAKEMGIGLDEQGNLKVHEIDPRCASDLEYQVTEGLKQWLNDDTAQGQFFGISRQDPPFRFSDSHRPESFHVAQECTLLERELFETDPEVVEYVMKKAETPERYDEAASIAYVRACSGNEPEAAWLKRAESRTRAIINLRTHKGT